MADDADVEHRAFALTIRQQLVIGLASVIAVAAIGGWLLMPSGPSRADLDLSSQTKRSTTAFYPSQQQWATLTVEPVVAQVFRAQHVTEGKIAVDEDRSTPIFSPYAGRVTKLLVKPGDTVERGQPLFLVEATDMVQAQNDFIAAVTSLNKARSTLRLAEINEKRQHDLYDGKAVALKEWQQAQAELTGAQNDVRAAEVALEASRNRLRILGRSEEQITAFQERGTISPETPIYAPIAGTIVQRKVGPGQYVSAGSSDPVFVIGDLSSVWLVAYVRETEASYVGVGQPLDFTVLAYPNRTFRANIGYVAASIDSTTRRLLVRANVSNGDGLLKPEMFASVNIATGEGDSAPAVPRAAVIFEGDTARVWAVTEDQGLELRRIRTGLSNGDLIQVLDGLKTGEKVVTKGSLFIDRIAAGS